MLANNVEICTVKEFCNKYTQFNEQQILRAIRAKKLKANKIGNRYIISIKEAKKYLGIEEIENVKNVENEKLKIEKMKAENEKKKIELIERMLKMIEEKADDIA